MISGVQNQQSQLRKAAWTIILLVGMLAWPTDGWMEELPVRGFTHVALAADAAQQSNSGAQAALASSGDNLRIAQAASSRPQSTLVAPIGLISPTTTLTTTGTPTATPAATPSSTRNPLLQPTATPQARQATTDDDDASGDQDAAAAEATVEAEEEGTVEDDDEEAEESAVAPLEGTIITNRTGLTARFFVEGETVDLAGGASTSYELPRPTTVLNLYNCAASTPESNVDCYWDPYVLQRDGFFEIYQSRPATAGTVARLMLRQADAPPTDQIWVQNRSGNVESIVFRNEVYELEPAAVEEFAVDPGLPAILYVRSCLSIEGQIACEWSPKALEAGVYYALTEVETAAAVANTALINVDLRPVVGGTVLSESAPDATAASAPTSTDEEPQPTSPISPAPVAGQTGEVICRVLVPALNIRSGPGLQYQIIGKIFSSEADPGDVRIVGRNADGQWFVVDPVVMPNGWVTASDSFISCSGSPAGLEIVTAPPLPVDPAPAPALVTTPEDGGNTAQSEGAADPAAEEGDISAGETETGADAAADVPEGYAILQVNNVFEHEVRFTIDQQYRRDAGPSEYDLAPGQSTSIVVFPGSLTFSVSSPWAGGLSGNTSINVESETTRPLWIRFVAESAGAPASAWELTFD